MRGPRLRSRDGELRDGRHRGYLASRSRVTRTPSVSSNSQPERASVREHEGEHTGEEGSGATEHDGGHKSGPGTVGCCPRRFPLSDIPSIPTRTHNTEEETVGPTESTTRTKFHITDTWRTRDLSRTIVAVTPGGSGLS